MPKMKQGDKVRIVRPGDPLYGRTGEITDVHEVGTNSVAFVKIMNQGARLFYEHDLAVISDPNTAELEAAREALQKTRERVSDLARENEKLKKSLEWWMSRAQEAADISYEAGKKRFEKASAPKVYRARRVGNARWITYNGVTYYGVSAPLLLPDSSLWFNRAGTQEPENDPVLIPVHDESYTISDVTNEYIRVRRIG